MRAKLLYIVEFILEHILCAFVCEDFARPSIGVSLKSCYRCDNAKDICIYVKHKPFRWQAFIECGCCSFATSHTATLYADAVKGAIEQWNYFHDDAYGTVSVYDDFS